MANIRLIKGRIKSASNISQITRAMEMVAASKMKKAQEKAVLGKPYAEKIYKIVKEMASRVEIGLHPLLSNGSENGKNLIILISTNKGLCGALNTNLFRLIHVFLEQNPNTDFISVGKKGESFVIRNNKHLIADFSENNLFINSVPAITKIFVDGFISGTYGRVYIVYHNFVSVLKQTSAIKLILPIAVFEEDTMHEKLSEKTNVIENNNSLEYVIEPSADDVLDSLLPHYLENQLRAAIFESEASEHSARMIAMKNATDAALDFMDALTLIYNKARQEKITYEIADIVTAKLAFE
jgi:F-type H+-transporting ATPase subunit gamma